MGLMKTVGFSKMPYSYLKRNLRDLSTEDYNPNTPFKLQCSFWKAACYRSNVSQRTTEVSEITENSILSYESKNERF